MKVIKTPLPGVLLIEPAVYQDSRGFFLESFSVEKYAAIGINQSFVQDNISHSHQGVLRGLHYQLRHPQAKLVTVTRGAVYDVAVDIRRGSPTFGAWVGFELSAENHRQLFIPQGFAHGFMALTEGVDFHYKCSNYYDPSSEFGVLWSDPDIAIQWPGNQPVLAAKDAAYPLLKNIESEYLPLFTGHPLPVDESVT